ncbi:MAG TPA: hypothetical protein VFW02_00100 [Candidatus Limnocylindrales bacterium]|nr:hypothetical protein [Candidatus Limnocylindrales bacterium]
MTRGAFLHYGYWLAVAVLTVFIVMLGMLLAVNFGLPELERAGVIGTAADASPSPAPVATATPLPSGMLSMGGALVPESGDCSGCHAKTPGTILAAIPVMAHPAEGWSKCTNCHATARLVDTAPGHSGIHASECTVCHQPGNLPAPLSRPHRDNQNQACLSCHGSTAPLPSDMTHRKETVCWLCHRLPTIEPPVPAHDTAPGEADCRTCHTAKGRAGALPSDHADRPAKLCLSCHEVRLGGAPSSSPRIQVFPAPSESPSLSPPPVPLGSLGT